MTVHMARPALRVPCRGEGGCARLLGGLNPVSAQPPEQPPGPRALRGAHVAAQRRLDHARVQREDLDVAALQPAVDRDPKVVSTCSKALLRLWRTTCMVGRL